MTLRLQKIYLESTDTVTEESSRKCVFNRMMLLHFFYYANIINKSRYHNNQIPTELALRLSNITFIGAEEVFICFNYEVGLTGASCHNGSLKKTIY